MPWYAVEIFPCLSIIQFLFRIIQFSASVNTEMQSSFPFTQTIFPDSKVKKNAINLHAVITVFQFWKIPCLSRTCTNPGDVTGVVNSNTILIPWFHVFSIDSKTIHHNASSINSSQGCQFLRTKVFNKFMRVWTWSLALPCWHQGWISRGIIWTLLTCTI